jgi:anti-sigma factor RsiW
MARKRISDSPLSARQQELAKQEAEVRRQMEDLERLIADAPRIAEAEQERQRQERIARASTKRSPLDAPDVLQDSRHGEDLFSERPRRPRRAERRAARTRLLVMCLAVILASGFVVFLAIQLLKHL